MTARCAPHFPGSLPLSSAEEVFTWAGRTLGDRALRVPDGETGDQRKDWAPYLPWFESNPTLEVAEAPEPIGGMVMTTYRVRQGVAPKFDRFEFADWARDSYAVFRCVRDAGGLPAGARFVVTLPHTIDVVGSAAEADSIWPVYDAYVEQHRASVDEVLDSIPHEDLAIQWDIPQAACVWTDYPLTEFLGVTDRDATLRTLVEHAAWIPEDVQLGYHLCFGDGGGADDDPTRESVPAADLPHDAAGVVELANDMTRAFSRRIDFLHIPTYPHWLEPEQFAPLAGLQLADGAEYSLGVINLRRDANLPVQEGVELARKRARSATEALGAQFGIATSCGMGRYTPEQFEAAGQLYRELDS